MVIFWKTGQVTALEASGVDAGRDVGSVGVFVPAVNGQTLTFTVDGDDFRDVETGSLWSIAGQASEGPLRGATLERIHHFDTFWFAWSTYRPGTTLIEED